MGHYASQCPKRTKAKKQQQQQKFAKSVEASGVDKLTTRLDTTFAMVSCLSMKTISGDRWYVDSRALRHMTCDKKIFNKFHARGRNACAIG
jgi:hypothetical protein